MQRRLIAYPVILSILILTACEGGATPTLLPTATPPPTLPAPSFTPTALPPPTVTPFPTGNVLTGGNLPTNEPTGSEQASSTSVPLSTITADQPISTPVLPTPTLPSSAAGFPPGVVVGQKVFAADFYQGWPATNDPTAKIRIIGGRYVFEIGPFDARFVTTTAVNHRDTYTQVEATPDQCTGGNDGGYGLLFRYVDANNYFLITFFCDNTFSVIARMAGSIVSGGFADGPLPDGLDATTSQLHTIGIRSKGNAHTLYFDSQEIGSFDAPSHEKGDVGLYAVSSGTDVVVVGFDNLQVWTVP